MFAATFTGLRRIGMIALALTAFVASSRAEDAPTAPRPVREIRVRIACDEEWRALPDWEDRARDRLAEASRIFETRFAIRWKAVGVEEWNSDDSAGTLRQLLEQVERDVPRAGAELVLGFTGQSGAAGSRRQYGATGLARYFGPAAVVRETSPEPRPRFNLGALVHELGHVFGAWHSGGIDSVMSFSGDRRTADTFDTQSAAVIELCRDVDFARGVDWLDEPRRGRMREIFRAGHAPDERLTYVDVEMERAWRIVSERGDVAAARETFRRALAEQAACVGPDDPSLVVCLRTLAWADLQGERRDVAEAESLARLALALVAANGVVEDPPLASEAVMADAAWERGRFDEAAVRYRLVYEARLEALGPADPNTVHAKSGFDRCGGAAPPARPWAEIECRMRAAPTAADLRFDAPAAGTIHVRPLEKVVLFNGTARADWAADAFAISTPGAGELSIELRESGAPPFAPASHSLKRRVPATSASQEVRVRFSFGTPGPRGTDEHSRYAFDVGIDASDETTPTSNGSFLCDAPWRAAARVTHLLDAGDGGFVVVPATTATTLRSWQWVGDVGQTVVVPKRGEDARVGGVAVTPDATAAKRAWRLELTFTPDAAK